MLPALVIALVMGACATGNSNNELATHSQVVSAILETPVTASLGDSADDPAIYVGKNGRGFVAATDKQAGLYIYNLDGSTRAFFPLGTLNNVDLRDGYQIGAKTYVLLVASNDEQDAIEVLLYDKAEDEFIQPKPHLFPIEIKPYGICLAQAGGRFFAGITSKKGVFQQYEIQHSKSGMVFKRVREFSTGGKTEGCAFDERTNSLFIAEEDQGLYRYDAAPGRDDKIVIAKTGQYGLQADLEGVAIYPQSEKGGYVIVSSQGNSSYALFQLPDYKFVTRFKIVRGQVDGTSHTDGLDATANPSPLFPKGFLVVQDDQDDTTKNKNAKRQNFKFVDWRDIEKIIPR